MPALKCALPLFLLVSFFSGQSHAQSFYKTTYQVQVRYEMWRNGSTYWATEFETTNLSNAQLVLQLFEAALEDGSLSEIMECGPDWIAIDVRLTTKIERYLIYDNNWLSSATLYR